MYADRTARLRKTDGPDSTAAAEAHVINIGNFSARKRISPATGDVILLSLLYRRRGYRRTIK